MLVEACSYTAIVICYSDTLALISIILQIPVSCLIWALLHHAGRTLECDNVAWTS
jgi:hypothetical protein